MPSYFTSTKKIKSSKKNYTAVLNAVNKAKQKAQWQYWISILGGVIAIATAITAIIVQAKNDTVGEVMQMLQQTFATQNETQQAMLYSIVSDLAD